MDSIRPIGGIINRITLGQPGDQFQIIGLANIQRLIELIQNFARPEITCRPYVQYPGFLQKTDFEYIAPTNIGDSESDKYEHWQNDSPEKYVYDFKVIIRRLHDISP
jgi:hypothetical protein